MTYRAKISATSSVRLAADHGERVTCRIDFVVKGSPPTMSRCTAALIRPAISGNFVRYAIVPVISDGQTNRIVRVGRASALDTIKVFNARAISRIAEQPLALSLAPGFW